ncbi:leu operon leader peptide [Kosakonia cowanii]|nr:leu operon leader peptide [Kosakonia cowanii]
MPYPPFSLTSCRKGLLIPRTFPSLFLTKSLISTTSKNVAITLIRQQIKLKQCAEICASTSPDFAGGLTSKCVSSTTKSISVFTGARFMIRHVRFAGLLLLNASTVRGRPVDDTQN